MCHRARCPHGARETNIRLSPEQLVGDNLHLYRILGFEDLLGDEVARPITVLAAAAGAGAMRAAISETAFTWAMFAIAMASQKRPIGRVAHLALTRISAIRSA